ncbi:Bax inhibitor-1/YccA family protein [Microbacterium paludicola]|uniref:Bax inhibitor-1/YccA family protein n=1 Tax=Microbacterium paludicola TaxID=300019 RepID=A0A4Y9FUY3_9MICO|nr:Bax inhibitor-1/YccA family protein [Microbacterium paludicola]MBF0816976.1 Bax inhibitor-1/YccA family protein [Microbacterium paludicola]TFU32352.1 Bax inhibitor-1/YccA family protein [Microbacterium paludicola]
MAKLGFTDPAFQTSTRPPQAPTSYAAQTYPGGAAAGQQSPGLVPPPASHLEGLYSAPSADAVDTGRMTVEDTIHKTLASFGVLLLGAVVGWWATLANPGMGLGIAIVGALAGFVLGLVNSFKRMPGAGLVLAYAGAEGLFIGAFSLIMEQVFPGIVMQATLATLAVVGVTLALFSSGKVRTSPRMTKIVMIAALGYLAFSLLNFGFMIFGGPASDLAWGMRSVEIMGIPLGVIIGILAVLLAAYMLVMDFEFVQNGARNGAPRKLGWKASFGIVATVIWIYVEILRVIAILRGND